MEKQSILDKSFPRLYVISVPIAIIATFIFHNSFFISYLTVNLTLDENVYYDGIVLAMDHMGFLWMTNVVIVVSLVSLIVNFYCYLTLASYSKKKLKDILTDCRNTGDFDVLIPILLNIFSSTFSSVLIGIIVGGIVYVLMAIISSFLALIPFAIIIRIIDLTYYGSIGKEAVFIIIKVFFFLILSAFINRAILGLTIDKLYETN